MPIAGTRAPLLTGWSGMTNPYSPTAGTRAPLLPTLPTRVSATPTTAPVQTPQMTLEEWLRQESSKWLQAQVDAINAQKQAYLDDLRQQQDLEIQRGQALSQALQGMNIPGRIQQIYGNASSDIGGLAQAFSGELRDQATADAAQQTRMLSGTGQEGAVPNNGAALGDVLYGSQGYIPARNASETGAAFASQAALEPGFAQRIGQVKGADVYSQGLEGLKQFTDALLQATSQQPQIEQQLLEQYQKAQAAAKPNLTARSLADGRIQWFDEDTGQPVGPPQGPKRSSSSTAAVKTVRLADGTYQAVDPKTGKPVGNPFGPKKTKSSSSSNLQARSLANGQIQWFDPATGKAVGAPQGPKRATTKKTAGGKSYNLQLKTLSDGSQQWFDPRTGRPIGPKISPPKAGVSKRPDGMTATQVRAARANAFQIVNGWQKNGRKDDEGNDVLPKDLLKYMTTEQQIPFDIAVKVLGTKAPAVKKWLKHPERYAPKSTKNVSNVTEIPNAPGYEPKSGVVQLPTHFQGTHVTDRLGWGTKTAHDFMAPAGAPVQSPVSGTIIYFHPTGAQGGGSMLIRGDDGYEYWLGHIEGGIPGGRIQAGQQIASIAHQSVSAPHVHIDRRWIGGSTV